MLSPPNKGVRSIRAASFHEPRCLRSKPSTMSDEENFEGGASGASTSYPSQASALRKGGHVLIKNHPCKIVEMSTSKTGKHGHAKVHLVGLDIFSGKKYEDICPSTHNMNVPNVKRADYQFVSLDDDNYLTLMDQDGTLKSDISIKEGDLLDEIKDKAEKEEEFMVTVLSAMGTEMPHALKNATK